MVVSIVSVVLGQSTRENEEMDFEDMGTVEGFIKTKEFRVSCWETKRGSKDSIHRFLTFVINSLHWNWEYKFG